MSPSFNLTFSEQGKPTFHQIEPRAAGGSKMEMKTRMLGQPPMNQGGFVSSVVIENQVDLKFSGHMGIDGVEELTKL
jgi:hypothetical protein